LIDRPFNQSISQSNKSGSFKVA